MLHVVLLNTCISFLSLADVQHVVLLNTCILFLSLADVKSLFQFEFSEEGSNELAAENQTYINFIHF